MNSAGPSRRPSTSSPLRHQTRTSISKVAERDIWGLGLSSDLPAHDPSSIFSSPTTASSSKPSLSPSRQASLLRRRPDPDLNDGNHPLYRSTSKSPPIGSGETEVLVLSDVSRPSLTRLTSDLERRAGSSRGGESEEGSRRGSIDRLRMSSGESTQSGEVEVLIHQVAQNESLAGIALLYGIDLATLRKTNKLWPSDPVHLRTHLYVPLEACRWNKASETLIRGPGEGQVTLAPKNLLGKGKGRAYDEGKEEEIVENLIDLGENDIGKGHKRSLSAFPEHRRDAWEGEKGIQRSFSDLTLQVEDLDPWANGDTAISPYNERPQPSWMPIKDLPDDTSPNQPEPNPHTRTLDIVRIPSSQLRFFPKQPRTSDSIRSSFDSGPKSSLRPLTSNASIPPQPPLSIQNDLNFSHDPPPPRRPSASKPGTVRLRPPSSTPTTANGLADKLSNLFFIPPPPPGGLSIPPPRPPVTGRNRISLESARSSARGSATASPIIRPVDELEMMSRERRGSVETLRLNNGVGRRGSERRKLD